MTSYPNITTYETLLAHGNLGSQNVDFYNGYGQLQTSSVALETLRFQDQDTFEQYKTYGAVANYYERNRRLNGAYGNTYYGDCNWLNPLNHFNLIHEDHFYYLQDFVYGGPYSNLFIQGLTFCTRERPAVYYQYYNSTFFTDPGSYYRVDILGDEYNKSHGGIKTDIVIQQISQYRSSDKLYLSFAQAVGGHGWHSEYQMRIPITLMLFNDKLYIPTVIIPPPSDPLDPSTDPVVNPIDPIPPMEPPVQQNPLISPYASWGGDTTDTGMSESGLLPYYAGRGTTREDVEFYFPSIQRWRRWFIWE